MAKVGKICAAAYTVALLGCVTGKTGGAPCYDGWTSTSQSSVSRVVSPSPELLSFLRDQVSVDLSAIQCVHELPVEEEYIALVREKSGDISAVRVRKVSNGFEHLENEIIY